jgi:hypothetical protein
MPSPTRTGRGKRAPKLDFPVTAEHIDTAIPEDSAHCMIADALKAAMPEVRSVSVDLATIRFTDPKTCRRYIYLTPIPAQVALLDFDKGEKPEPFTVKCHAAQIVETKKARSERTAASPSVPATSGTSGVGASPSVPEAPDGMPAPRHHAKLMPNPAGGGTVPIKLGGSPPPLGPLARGSGTNKTGPKYRTGRKRSFGLRAMGH